MTQPKSKSLKFYKVKENAQMPVFATKKSACFDLHACLVEGDDVQMFHAVATKQLPRRISIFEGKPFVQLNNM